MNTGPAPYKVLTANTAETGQRSSFWVIAVCSFGEPAAMYSPGKKSNPVATKQIIIIENDALSVSINSSKDSFGEMANITLKSTNVYYPALVHSGDWLFIWMFDDQNKANKCIKLLNTIVTGGSVGTQLCDYKSGLKHVGRITGVQSSDRVSNSSRTITQSIQSQAFLEFATSVYYTYTAAAAVGPASAPSNNTGALSYAQSINLNQQTNGMDKALTGMADKFLNFYKNVKDNSNFSPDNIIALFFIIVMGIDSDADVNKIGPVKGTVNDAISIPSDVAKIMGTKARKLWQLYNLVLGVQSFKADPKNWHKSFAPLTNDDTNLVKRSPMRCKGFVHFAPNMWSNQSMWSTLTPYLNSVVNEMFTSLRLNKDGILKPTLTVREKPFTTGLFSKFTSAGGIESSLEAKPVGGNSKKEVKNSLVQAIKNQKTNTTEDAPELKQGIVFGSAFQSLGSMAGAMGQKAGETTHFATLPRWMIDSSIVLAFDWSTDEAHRVNFVQVFGRTDTLFAGASNVTPEAFKSSQFVAGNYVADEADIARSGLRAIIEESPYDMLSGNTVSGSMAPLWARMNADWLFNGHLKAQGSITLQGVWEPIVKGDNLQYNGILFHIEGVTHTATLSGGIKTWTTTVSLSRGVLATSMIDTKSVPAYPAHANFMKFRKNVPGPGFTVATERRTDQMEKEKPKAYKGVFT